MVAHLSYKFTHLAQSLRAGHLTNTLRNAFPSTATPAPTFDFTSNVFGAASNAAQQVGGTGLGLGLAAGGAFGAGAVAANGNGGATGGAGGASSKAGNWSTWGLQSKTLNQGQVAQADSQLDNEDDLRLLASSSARRSLIRQSRSPVATRPRRKSHSALSPSSPTRASHPDLLRADEAGLSSVRLAGGELQRMYHTAVAQGNETEVAQELEREADEIELLPPSRVSTTGRRASVSLSGLAVPRVAPLVSVAGLGPSRRSLHSSSSASAPVLSPSPTPAPSAPSSSQPIASPSASSFPSTLPPQASVPSHRRNSTSAVPSSSEPLAPGGVPYRKNAVIHEGRPPVDGTKGPRKFKWAKGRTPEQIVKVGQENGQLLSQEGQAHRNAIEAADKQSDPAVAARAIQQYLASPSSWSTGTHNAALHVAIKFRAPNEPLDRIVELYNQLFNTPGLHATRSSYEHIIRAFCARDDEVRQNIGYIERRIKKKVLAGKARGKEVFEGSAEDLPSSTHDEALRLEQLRSGDFDYYTPALQIYKALGPLGDRISGMIVEKLMGCAAERGEVDVALALFERLEKSKSQRPSWRAFDVLLQMYGGVEKDSELVKEVFEGYLTARANKSLYEVDWSAPPPSKRLAFRYNSVKHAYDTSPEYVLDTDNRRAIALDASGSIDERVWSSAIRAHFDAGNSVAAVELLERLLAAQSSTEALPGYPTSLSSRTVALCIVGFLRTGDEVSARKWFDQFSDSAPTPYYTHVLYTAVDTPFVEFFNHVYRTAVAAASRETPLVVSDFYTVIDRNLAEIWSATSTPQAKRVCLDAVAEFHDSFERATKAGLLDGLGQEFTASTGLLHRIANAQGNHGDFSRASSTFVAFANVVRAAMRDTPADAHEARQQHLRPRFKWAIRLTEAAMGSLGLRRTGHRVSDVELIPAGSPVPAIQDAVKIASWTNKLLRVVDAVPDHKTQYALVQSYLASRAAVNGDIGSFGLNGDDWYTVLEAFAQAQAHISWTAKTSAEGGAQVPELPFEFPGFRLAFEDFVSQGVEIPVGQGLYDYGFLAKKLRQTGFKQDEIRHVVETMSRNVSFANDSVTAEFEVTAIIEDDSTSLASVSHAPATSATAPSDLSASVADASEAPQHYPTPPSTPPSYFAELPPAPALPEPIPSPPSFDRVLGTQLEELAYVSRAADVRPAAEKGYSLAISAAQEGRFAHPDAYGRLVEQLGRQHLVNEVRQIYLLAYQALNAMSNDPDAQSVSWVVLEDRMIVALAQAGELIDVGHHRDRLLQAGSAPSADAYAAMILNMKDTTDDATVALSLFEESQRLGVRPNVYLFNTLISKLSRARRAKEGLEYFELMKQYGIAPTSITYGAIINACCKIGDDVSADYLFSEMVSRPDFKPRVPPYNSLIQFFVTTKPDRQRALHYYDLLVKAGVHPSAHTYKLLLDAYGTVGDIPDLEAMQQVFARLVKDKKVVVSGAHWASLVTAYGVTAKDVDRAITIFESIATHPTSRNNPTGPLPDAVVYEALLNALIANGRAELSDKYLAEMRDKGVRMTAYVANTLIKGYTAQSLYPAARAIFSAMSEPPSGVASLGNHPIDRHSKHHHQTASSPASVDAPTYREPSTYEAMILCELKAGETVKAAEVLQLAEARAFPPAVIGRLRKLLADEGIEALPLSQ